MGRGVIKNINEFAVDGVDVTLTINVMYLALAPIVLGQGFGLGLKDAQAIDDGLLVIIGTVAQVAATFVALTVKTGGRGIDVEHLAAGFTGAAAGQALEQGIELDLDEQHAVDGLADAVKHGVQGLGLGDIAGEAV